MGVSSPITRSSDVSIVWFRRDLRISNNPALSYALEHSRHVIPIYINHPKAEKWAPGAASKWWCHESLQRLNAALKEQGLNLHCFTGDPIKVITSLVTDSGAKSICWNNLYEPDELILSDTVKQSFSNIEIKYFDSHVLFPPGTILNKQEKPYRVFTPFWKSARIKLELIGVNPSKSIKTEYSKSKFIVYKNECSIEDLGLLDENQWHQKLLNYCEPGELAAKAILDDFIHNSIYSYDKNRDVPGIAGTSKLSAHLHFGEITPAQIILALQQHEFTPGFQVDIERFITEIGWREFANHILWHFPFTAHKPMNDKFDKLWTNKCNMKKFNAWKTGTTGYPIIDAGMRELRETGWMHNRVRMIVGSFLTKNLGIHWLHGARWFWDNLVDADLASNSMGWQWVAGCGVDAAPYYRIFNPHTQAKRFDPDACYINKWLPSDYGQYENNPIVNLQQSRADALLRYKNL